MVRQKANISLLCFLLLVCSTGNAQKKLIQSLDTIQIHQNRYLNSSGEPVEIEQGKMNEKVDIKSFDSERVEAALLFRLNQWRNKSKKDSLVLNGTLQNISSGYVSKYGKSRFENSSSSVQRMKIFLKKVPRYMELSFSYIEGAIGMVKVVDYNRNQYFYSNKYEGSEVDLFAGSKSKVDSLHPAIPLHLKTYDQLVNEIMKLLTRGRYARYTKSKAYDLVGVSVRVASFSTKRINQVKFMLLIGGYRNKYILLDEE